MWGEDDIGDGGFDVSGYDSQATGSTSDKGTASRKPSSVTPVTIRQVLESPDDNFIVAGSPVTMMTVVGIVKAIEITSTKIMYQVEDWTGTLTGLLWLEGDAETDATSKVIENTYCRMTGTRRNQEGAVCLFVYDISPIRDLNEINHHYVEVIFLPMKAEEMNQMQADLDSGRMVEPSMRQEMSASYAGMAGNPGNVGSAFSNNLNLTPQQLRVYQVLQKCPNDNGLDAKEIYAQMPNKMPVAEIEKVLTYLVDEGHIYATIDDFHFCATDRDF